MGSMPAVVVSCLATMSMWKTPKKGQPWTTHPFLSWSTLWLERQWWGGSLLFLWKCYVATFFGNHVSKQLYLHRLNRTWSQYQTGLPAARSLLFAIHHQQLFLSQKNEQFLFWFWINSNIFNNERGLKPFIKFKYGGDYITLIKIVFFWLLSRCPQSVNTCQYYIGLTKTEWVNSPRVGPSMHFWEVHPGEATAWK